MLRSRNGYLRSPFFLSAGDGGASAGDSVAVGDITVGSDAVTANVNADASDSADKWPEEAHGDNDTSEVQNAEIARLKAEIAKQKSERDKAMREAGEARKALKAKMTAEEIAAKEKEEADERAAQELETLRKEVAKGKTVKSVMGKLGLDEDSAGNLADALYGAADIENALLEIQKAWQSREKALRLEYGKITGPGAGADSNSPEAQAIKRAADIGKARNAQNEQALKAMSAYMR